MLEGGVGAFKAEALEFRAFWGFWVALIIKAFVQLLPSCLPTTELSGIYMHYIISYHTISFICDICDIHTYVSFVDTHTHHIYVSYVYHIHAYTQCMCICGSQLWPFPLVLSEALIADN